MGRSYSLASVPALDDDLELHIRRVPGGVVSGWVDDRLQVGATASIGEALGDCFYVPGRPDQPLLLIGTGSGLAPLYGIARDALQQGHRGPIKLYHGSSTPDSLYLVQELQDLALKNPGFDYRPCVSRGDAPAWATRARADDRALEENPNLAGWRVYVCGNPIWSTTQNAGCFSQGRPCLTSAPIPFYRRSPSSTIFSHRAAVQQHAHVAPTIACCNARRGRDVRGVSAEQWLWRGEQPVEYGWLFRKEAFILLILSSSRIWSAWWRVFFDGKRHQSGMPRSGTGAQRKPALA